MYRTTLCYQPQGAATLYTLITRALKITPFASLAEPNRQLFKSATEDDSVVITAETIFHPQGGGQPSDTGRMRMQTSNSNSNSYSDSASNSVFDVTAVRHDVLDKEQVLHLGRFTSPAHFRDGDEVEQSIDQAKRLYYSRLHTAGHVLGVAVRDLLAAQVPDFAELKASHFPDSAACEFRGLIDGKHKAAIQAKVDEYCAKAMPVEVDWWDEEEFRRSGVEMPDLSLVGRGKKFRVVKIVGAEAYPCGGTHVPDTSKCGKITVKKISRSKGVSRVSYSVEE